MKKIILVFSLLPLFSCKKEEPQEKIICNCYELVYRKDMLPLNPEQYLLVDTTAAFEDLCVYDGNERFNGDLKWVKVCK